VWSCSEEKLDPNSIFVESENRNTPFDQYLYREFVLPYNVSVKYWLDDKEIDPSFMLLPPSVESSKIMSVLLKHLWLDVYSEASPDGMDFVRLYVPRNIQYIGSRGYQVNGNELLGLAGGKGISLFDVNALSTDEGSTSLTPGRLLSEDGYFHTIHHEFAHILHQMKSIPENFQPISVTDYVLDDWADYSLADALALGFITRYARSSYYEDFVEIISVYICSTQEQWDARLALSTDEGRAIIALKLDIISTYMKASWNMDLNLIRSIILRRAGEIDKLEFVDLK
jgi:substrate import-associated zinc metallohydrolase lipoprotein